MGSTLQALIVTLGILALAGLFALIESLYDRRRRRRREEAERARATGVLVGFAEEQHRHRHRKPMKVHYVTVYRPIVRFQVDGVEYKLKSDGIVPRDQFQEGQPVDLLYDPDNPAHFHLDRGDVEERSTRGAVVFALAWLACALAAIALLLHSNPHVANQLKRTLYNATAPLRSGANPSQDETARDDGAPVHTPIGD